MTAGTSGAGGERSVTIVGAGLVGSLAGVYLARRGWDVHVFERRADPRAAGYVGGRSINLALSARGLWGLAGVGLEEDVRARMLPMRGRLMHPPAPGAALVYQAYSSRAGDAINSISRGELNIALLNACDRERGIKLHFEQRCLDIDIETGTSVFRDESARGGGAERAVKSRLILGADGAFSPVRLRMQRADRFDYQQTYLEHGYKELHIPATRAGEFALDPAALHIWPRKSAMMIALPNLDRSFTCTLFWPFEGEHSFGRLKTDDQVRAFFEANYPDVPGLMPTLCADYAANPTSSLVTVRCWPWTMSSKDGRHATVLLGDAAHAIVPFFGQGMNCGFEDCRVLGECLDGSGGDVQSALEQYQRLRKPNAEAIADMALENFVEMRDKVGDASFLRRKRLEQALHEWFPDKCVPKYNLVSFSTVAYAEAKRRGAELDALVDRLLAQHPQGGERGAFGPEVRETAAKLLGAGS